MKSSSVLLLTVRFLAVMLVSILLLPLAPRHVGHVAVAMPDVTPLADQRLLDAEGDAEVASWTRTLDPAIVTGSQLPLFSGVALHDLFVYAYDSATYTWTQVPFQFDEVDATQTFVSWENGTLDANDELVFMGADLGDQAAPYHWIDDDDSRSYSRYEVLVTNPLDPAEEGWVYVYRSATLSSTFSPYLTWNAANNRISGSAYIIGWTPSVHFGMDSLQLNGTGVDVLDRAKLRLSGECYIDGDWQIFVVDEDDDEVKDEYAPPSVKGKVRIGGGDLDSQTWYYAAVYEGTAQFDAGYVPGDCENIRYKVFRVSDDWRNPSVTGMAPTTYYDANNAGGVPLDGVFDPVAPAPVSGWRQVSGALGSIVQVSIIDSPGGGQEVISNYYWDVSDPDPDDTGDQQSFGDAGFKVSWPNEVINMTFATYVLGASQPNVGATYEQYRNNPLEAAATAQSFDDCLASGIALGWLPRPVYRGVETTLSATVAGGTAPFTYDWTFGDDGGIAAGNPVTHTFTLTGVLPVTLTVSSACDAAAPVIRHVMVWEPGTEVYGIYLPAVLSKGP
jgi:hypothetical protein